MSKESGLKYIEKMQLYRDMMCDYGFNTVTCRLCKYYYTPINQDIPRCLKEQIRDWALYHIERG